MKLLSEAIGIELEFEAQEQGVGPFRADILCKDIGTDDWVLIENQLERTDHTHLGQLLTHATGLSAVTIDWTLRESARARIRVMVKRILNRYGYPPDLQEEAVKTVLLQAELLCADWAVDSI